VLLLKLMGNGPRIHLVGAVRMFDSGTAIVGKIAWRVLWVGWDAESFELGGQVRVFYPIGHVVDLLVVQHHASCDYVRVAKMALVVWIESHSSMGSATMKSHPGLEGRKELPVTTT
jgi:hypothetical protein